MKELEEIYNRLYDEYIDARREHFESALDMKKNGDRIYHHVDIFCHHSFSYREQTQNALV